MESVQGQCKTAIHIKTETHFLNPTKPFRTQVFDIPGFPRSLVDSIKYTFLMIIVSLEKITNLLRNQ